MVKKRINVLLVEDDEVDAEWVRRALAEVKKHHFHLEEVGLLRAAIGRLKKGGIDIVLLDLGLPDISGLDAVKTIRKEAPDISLVLLTGQSVEDSPISKILQEGTQDYLVKGEINSESLARCIIYSIERNQLTIKLKEANAALNNINEELKAENERILEEQKSIIKQPEGEILSNDKKGVGKKYFDNLLKKYKRLLDVYLKNDKKEIDVLVDELCSQFVQNDMPTKMIVELHIKSVKRVVDDINKNDAQKKVSIVRMVLLIVMTKYASLLRSERD